jgi:hypothetical protein
MDGYRYGIPLGDKCIKDTPKEEHGDGLNLITNEGQ